MVTPTKHQPIADFFLGLILGIISLLSVLFLSLFAVLVPIVIGILVWVQTGRKFFALGFFLSLPIAIFILFLICGAMTFN
ncbi:hypothetical protein J5Y03_08875 [Bacillus sp. RG28]|uniref:Uncharacterized protein n=1 Tax=Gottfriedia endophytica TaxID=2820819 RepID=A0A940NQW7_9BACI|nr:hypothetical protein [Gottfriedia endophytica]MBP0725302.1 hypothetical protein [Gottfriedia endophytica]